MKKIDHFFKSYTLVCSKSFFRLYINKSVKAIWNLIFPKDLVYWGIALQAGVSDFSSMFDFYTILT